jgi:hypothetical protein
MCEEEDDELGSQDSDTESQSTNDEDEDDESFVTDSSDGEEEAPLSGTASSKKQLKLSQIDSQNPLFGAGAAEFDSEYARQSAALEAARASNRLTGGQYLFQQKLLDLEFREIHHLRELRGGSAKQ